MPLGVEVGLSTGDFVLDGDPAPSPKGVVSPIFGPRLLWPNGCMDQDATCRVGRGLGDIVLDRDSATTRKKECTHFTQFLAHVYCGQTAGWIKMPLVTEVNLGRGDVVLDGVAASPKSGTAPPVFRFMSIVAKQLDR